MPPLQWARIHKPDARRVTSHCNSLRLWVPVQCMSVHAGEERPEAQL
jgi:hypothetical protein